MEGRRGAGPGACCEEDGLEEECDGQAAEVVRQGDNEETTGANSEDVADYCSLDGCLGHVPLSVMRGQSLH